MSITSPDHLRAFGTLGSGVAVSAGQVEKEPTLHERVRALGYPR